MYIYNRTSIIGASVNNVLSNSQVGEKVDAKDLRMGAWFEAQVVKVTKDSESSSSGDDFKYHVKYDE